MKGNIGFDAGENGQMETSGRGGTADVGDVLGVDLPNRKTYWRIRPTTFTKHKMPRFDMILLGTYLDAKAEPKWSLHEDDPVRHEKLATRE